MYKGSSISFIDTTINKKDAKNLKSELIDLSKLEPEEKTLGLFPIKSSLYTLGDTAIDHYILYQEVHDTKFIFFFDYDKLLKKIKPLAVDTSKFRIWLTTKVGEKPQVVDSALIKETEDRFVNYLYNRGYFYSAADFNVNYNEYKKTGRVNYTVTLNTLYKMRNIYYEITDKGLINKINLIPVKSQLAPGKPFDVDLLKAERLRITNNLRNVGYYKFQKEYIYFEVDSTSGQDSLDIFVKVSNPVNDTVHHIFSIRNIYVYPNAELDYKEGVVPDYAIHYIDSSSIKNQSKTKVLAKYLNTNNKTVRRKSVFKKDKNIRYSQQDSIIIRQWTNNKMNDDELLKYFVAKDSSSYKQFFIGKTGKLRRIEHQKLRSDYYLINSKNSYNPQSIANNIFINPKVYYSDSLIQKTVVSFSTVGMFKYVSVQALEDWDTTSYLQYLDLLIRMDPIPVRTVGYELNASTTSDYLFGNSVTINYLHRNLFRNLDLFKVNLKGGIETQLGGDVAFINTSEFNAGIGSSIPRFMWPFPFEVPKRYYPKTDLNLNFNYIKQIHDFTLYNTSFEYAVTIFETSKRSKAQKQHILKAPIPTINIVKVPEISDEFQEELNQNPLLRQSFEEVVIVGYGYTFIRNTQPTGIHKRDTYLRATLELNAPFSDFGKLDADYRFYWNLNKANKIVARTAGGIAYPFNSNSSKIFDTEVIPYVKQFFTGGAYSLRAFSVRKLGPGAFVFYDTASGLRVDQVADMKLEFNLEYRFDIFGPMKGALFCDAGNVFTLKEDPYRLHSQFSINSIALGPGFGLRFDFAYVVVRLDAAYPAYDPALDGPYAEEYKLYYESIGFEIPEKKIVYSLAIGYPF
ncbi:MAG: BamA/TamA family outer membrane protein [Chitinophagales bacterium]